MAAEFGNATLWMKLVMLLVSAAFSMHLFAMDVPTGWTAYQIQACRVYGNGNGNNGNGNGNGNAYGNVNSTTCTDNADAVRAVQALEVIGFLLILISLFLSLCLVLLDELKGNRVALVVLCICSFLGGMCIIAGIGVYEGKTNSYGTRDASYQYADGTEFASAIGVMAGISAMLGGMFCIFELLRCS